MRLCRVILCVVLALAPGAAARGETYFVRVSGNDANDGRTPSSAFATLGAAVSVVSAGDTVYIGAGVHAGGVTIIPGGTEADPIRFIGDIDGAQTGDAGEVTVSLVGSGTVISVSGDHVHAEDITIEGGSAGVRIDAGSGVRLARCVIRGQSGSGVEVVNNGSVTIERCVIREASDGVEATNGAALITDTLFHGLVAALRIRNSGSSIEARRVTIRDCSSNGAHADNGSLTLVNTLIHGIGSDAVRTRNKSSLVMVHCTLDTIGSEGAAFSGNATLYNNIFSNIGRSAMRLESGSVTASHNLIHNKGVWNSHGFNSLEYSFDPEYEDPENGDYSLGESSRAVDLGLDMSSYTDLDRNARARPLDDGWDIGAYEGAGSPVFYVSTRGSDGNDGLTPGTPLRTIGRAVSLCVEPSCTIYVAPGTYAETVEVGFGAGAEAVDATRDEPTRVIADTLAAYTIADPGPVVIDGSDARTHAVHIRDTDHWSFEGFTIRGQTRYAVQTERAGVRLIGCTIRVPSLYALYAQAEGPVHIEGCVFERDEGSRHTGWIQPASASSRPDITITRNDSARKDALYGSSNLSDGFGGAFQSAGYGWIIFASRHPLGRVEVSNNQVSDTLLGVYCYRRGTDSDTIIVNNTVTESYYGIYAYRAAGSGETVVQNNIAASCYLGILVFGDAAPSVLANIEHDIAYDMSRFTRPYASGITNADPRFHDAPTGDFSLIEGSPAIDAGSAPWSPALDIGSRPRPRDGDGDGAAHPDIGAYELVAPRRGVRMVRWREVSGHRDMPGP